MEHWDTLKSLYSQQTGGGRLQNSADQNPSTHTLQKHWNLIHLFLKLCRTPGDSSTIGSMEKICLRSYASKKTACFQMCRLAIQNKPVAVIA